MGIGCDNDDDDDDDDSLVKILSWVSLSLTNES